MKKILTVLMMVLGLSVSVAFAKPVDIETDDYYIFADDETKQVDFSGLSDVEIIVKVVNAIPEKTGEYKNVLYGIAFEKEVDILAKKYINYFQCTKDGRILNVVQNLGDGRVLYVFFNIET